MNTCAPTQEGAPTLRLQAALRLDGRRFHHSSQSQSDAEVRITHYFICT